MRKLVTTAWFAPGPSAGRMKSALCRAIFFWAGPGGVGALRAGFFKAARWPRPGLRGRASACAGSEMADGWVRL